MTFSLNKLIPTVDETVNGFNSAGFRSAIEAQLRVIINHSGTTTVLMTGNDNLKYRGDLGGWLLARGIREDYHWVIARVNGLTHPSAYDGVKVSFLLPSVNFIDTLLQRFKNSLN